MNEPNGNTPPNSPPPLGQTLFLSGICVVLGTVAFMVGAGVIPSGSVERSASTSLIGMAAGLLFIFAGCMVFIRDRAGAKNGEELPKNAPLAFKIGEGILQIVLLVLFASVGSVIAFGPFFMGGALPDLERQMGTLGAAIFRILNGGISLVLWYAAGYLLYQRMKKLGGGDKQQS